MSDHDFVSYYHSFVTMLGDAAAQHTQIIALDKVAVLMQLYS